MRWVFTAYMRKRISIIKIYVSYYVSYLLRVIRKLCHCESFVKVTLFMGISSDGCPESYLFGIYSNPYERPGSVVQASG
jgi:hypothetical protein